MRYWIIIAVFAALFVAWNWLFIRRSSAALRAWATEHGYVIVRSDISLGAPFRAAALSVCSASRGRLDYSVTLLDSGDVKRSALVSCGGFVRGVFSCDEIEITWTNEAAA